MKCISGCIKLHVCHCATTSQPVPLTIIASPWTVRVIHLVRVRKGLKRAPRGPRRGPRSPRRTRRRRAAGARGPVDRRGRAVIRHYYGRMCSSHRDSPYKQDGGRQNGRRSSSKRAGRTSSQRWLQRFSSPCQYSSTSTRRTPPVICATEWYLYCGRGGAFRALRWHMAPAQHPETGQMKIIQGWPKLWANFRALIGISATVLGQVSQFGPTLYSFR